MVVDLLLRMGYGNTLESGDITKKSNDQGIDGIISQDKLGLENIYVQAKRQKASVGRQDVQNFVGALDVMDSNKGVFITTSRYTQNAIEFIDQVNRSNKTIILIDGSQLTELMIEYNVGVNTIQTYSTKKVDSDYFENE